MEKSDRGAAEAACGEAGAQRRTPTARAAAEAACGEGTRRAGRGAEGAGTWDPRTDEGGGGKTPVILYGGVTDGNFILLL